MKDRLISFETAKLAKEKHFNIPCDARWWIEPCSEWKESDKGAVKCDNREDDSISRPTQSLLQKWLRETHNIHVCPFDEFNEYILLINYYNGQGDKGEIWKHKGPYKKYEEALEIGLLEGLELIK